MTGGAVVRYVRDRAGDSLRAVVEYEPDDYDVVYVRSDLGADDVDRRAGVLHAHLAGGDRSGPGEVTATLGDPYASVQLREEAVIVNLVTGDGRGVLVSMETDVCRDLHGFVTECLSRADGDTEPSIVERRI